MVQRLLLALGMTASLRLTSAPDPRNDSIEAARRAGLHYVRDDQPGLRRMRRGSGFTYVSASGKPLRDMATLARIRALAIPPAWTSVWICASAGGHIQATGRDARGRKQYRYHGKFRSLREETKYERLFDFAQVLPKIRARRDLSTPGLSRGKVLAAVVCLLEHTLIRVGNEEYSRLNQSFGLTTLRDGHARIRGHAVEFRFRGKSGKQHAVAINDRRLAAIIKRCRDLPGDELFQYVDANGSARAIGSTDVNAYLRSITGADFSAKDFRTWAGTVMTAMHLAEQGSCASIAARKKRIVEATQRTAERLGNTPSVCRKCYVHPGVFEAYLRGRSVPRLATNATRTASAQLRADEKAVLAFLCRYVADAAREQRPGGLVSLLQKSVRSAHHPVGRASASARTELRRWGPRAASPTARGTRAGK